MDIKSQLMLRVEGVAVVDVNLRHPGRDGHILRDKYEIVVSVPSLGKFALTDDCNIEVKGRGAWRKVSATELLAILAPR